MTRESMTRESMTRESMTSDPELDALLTTVQQAYSSIDDVRLRYVVCESVASLHELVRRIGLTRDEWMDAIAFLTAVGQACREDRQEFILLSDLLGVSSAVEKLSAPDQPNATSPSVQGPFYVPGSREIPFAGSVVENDFKNGQTVLVSGRVSSASGDSIENAAVEVWQTAPNHLYAVQDAQQNEHNLRGIQRTNERGEYAFHTLKPVPYPVPTDGPCGRLLEVAKRHGLRAAHIHFRITAPGFEPLVTQIYPADDPYLDSDTVFAVEQDLTVDFNAAPESIPAELVAQYDFVLSRLE